MGAEDVEFFPSSKSQKYVKGSPSRSSACAKKSTARGIKPLTGIASGKAVGGLFGISEADTEICFIGE